METNKQNADFLNIGNKILDWYHKNGRILPFRMTKNPYKIWISEIVFQQTRIQHVRWYYVNFIERFPNVESLANVDIEEVMLYWKGLGYYSRALNIHKASKQIIEKFNGEFPSEYQEILKLSGIGKYTAAAIASICFDEDYPAVDGNFYRVLSRLFADDFDISQSKSFDYFATLALKIMPKGKAGDFNQAIMDMGAEVCKPKPHCGECPVQEDCLAFSVGKQQEFPVKNKKTKQKNQNLTYYFVENQNKFLIRRRGTDSIWKNLNEFPTKIPKKWQSNIVEHHQVNHKLTHLNLGIDIYRVIVECPDEFQFFADREQFVPITHEEAIQKSFPKPLENYIDKMKKT